LKQAPEVWNSKIDEHFQANGFIKCPYEHALYTKKEKNEDFSLVCLYVDDLIFTGNNARMIQEFKDSMIRKFEMTDIGLMSYYFSIEVKQEEKGIFICQKVYAKFILKKFNMEESNAVSTLVDCGIKLSRYNEGSNVDATYFKSLVGSLHYLTYIRPNILYGVELVSRYMEKPKSTHLMVAKRILRYIKVTISYGLLYTRYDDFQLIGYTDSD